MSRVVASKGLTRNSLKAVTFVSREIKDFVYLRQVRRMGSGIVGENTTVFSSPVTCRRFHNEYGFLSSSKKWLELGHDKRTFVRNIICCLENLLLFRVRKREFSFCTEVFV